MFHDTLWSGQLIIFIMGLVLLVSLMLGKKNKGDERLRIAGEAIFLIPLVYLIF